MKVKVVDRMANYINAKLDVSALISSYFPDYEYDGLVVCPFHEDSRPSLHIAPDGKAYCHSPDCTYRATNIIELVADLDGTDYPTARRDLYRELVDALPEALVKRQHQLLIKHKLALHYLHLRKIDDNTINHFQLGFEPKSMRITVPIMDQMGTCVNIRRFSWIPKSKSKYRVLNTNGHGENRIFPEDRVYHLPKVFLVGGEWDAMIGHQAGLPAATWTGGEGSWNHDYDWLFSDKGVYILYDNDPAGLRGAENAARQARKTGAARVEVIDPDRLEMKPGEDLNDLYRRDPMRVEWLAGDIQSDVVVHKHTGLCPYCGQTMPEDV